MFLLIPSVSYDYHKEIIMSQEIVRETVVIDSHHVKGYAFNIDIKAVPVERYGIPTYTYSLVKEYIGKPGYQFIKDLNFQIGDPGVYGVNGVTNEALLAIMIHRLQGFQNNSSTNCSENQEAINHMELAMEALYSRTHRLQAAKK
jgi:hypothetical protein